MRGRRNEYLYKHNIGQVTLETRNLQHHLNLTKSKLSSESLVVLDVVVEDTINTNDFVQVSRITERVLVYVLHNNDKGSQSNVC